MKKQVGPETSVAAGQEPEDGDLCTALDGNSEKLLSGDVRYFRLPEVLQLIAMQRLTGRLTMERDGHAVVIYVRAGRVAFATGEKRARRELLGFILTKMGRLTSESLETALNISTGTGMRLGEVLLAEGMATREDIKAALVRQTERSVYKAMAWGEGRFYFQLCALPDFVEETPAGLRVEDLILEGVRRIGEARLIAEKIPALDVVFTSPVYSNEELDGSKLSEEERLVLGLVDGRLDVRGLLEESGMSEFVLMKALYGLYSAGIIKKLESAFRADKTHYL